MIVTPATLLLLALLPALAFCPWGWCRASYACTLPLRAEMAAILGTPVVFIGIFDDLLTGGWGCAIACLPPAAMLLGMLAAIAWPRAACRGLCILLGVLYVLTPWLIRACGGWFIMS